MDVPGTSSISSIGSSFMDVSGTSSTGGGVAHNEEWEAAI